MLSYKDIRWTVNGRALDYECRFFMLLNKDFCNDCPSPYFSIFVCSKVKKMKFAKRIFS